MELQRLMIVDDEKIILKGLLETYAWEEMGFEVVGSALSGEEALEKMRDCKPDVVLTDICMKKMDGLALMAESKKCMPDVKFVVLSAYKDFEYAQKACEYGALTYLVKPIEEEQLYQVFSKVSELCRQEKKHKKAQSSWKRFVEADENHFMQFMLERYLKQMISVEEFRKSQEGLQNRISKEHFFCCVRIDVDILYKIGEQDVFQTKRFALFSMLEELLKKDYEVLASISEDEGRVYLLDMGTSRSSMKIKNMIRDVQEELELKLISAVSNSYQGESGMLQSYTEVNKLYDMAYEAGGGTLVNMENVESSSQECYPKEIENEILSAIRKNEEGQLKEGFIRFIYSLPPDETVDKRYLHQIAISTELLLGDTYGMTLAVQMGYQDFYQALYKCTGVKLADILYKLLGLVIEERKACAPSSTGRYFGEYIENACEYIRDHLDDERLSIADVADYVFLNQVYFGRVFKQVMKISFKQYLLKTRMEYAKQLLSESDDSINDICVKVGISNPSYFSKLFKQDTGMLPSEYKRNQE